MTKTETFTKPRSLSTQITRRVLLLSLIGVMGLASSIILGLLLTLQQVQNRMDKVSLEAVREFDLFFLDIQSDLLASSDSLAARNDVDAALLHIQARNDSFLDVLLVNFDGTILTQRNAVGRLRQSKIAEPSWLESPPPFGEVYIGAVGFESQAPFVDMAVRATDDIGLPAGLLWVRVDLTELWNTTLDIQVGKKGYAYITDDTGQLVAYRNRRLLESGSNLARLVGHTPQAIARSRLSLYTGLSDQLVLASAQSLKAVPWFAVVEQPVTEALAPFLIPAAMLLLVLLAVGLLLYNIIKFTRARIVAPLLALSDVVGQMTGGRLDQRIEVKHDDELGQLARSFNRMAGQLQSAFEDLEDQVVKLKRAEGALREEKAFTEAALNSQRDTFFVFDPSSGRAVRWNRAFAEISGYSDAEIAGMKAPDAWYSTENVKLAAAAIENILQQGQATIAMSLITKDRREIPFEYVASSVKNVEGDPQYIIAIGRDITARKQAEDALRESEARFRTLVEHAPETIIVFDADTFRFTEVNEHAERLFGLKRKDLLKLGPLETSPPTQPNGRLSSELAEVKIRQALEGEVLDFEWTHRNAAGDDIPCEVRLVRLPAAGRNLLRASIIDITERKWIEEELRKYREHLEELVDARTAELAQRSTQLETASQVARNVISVLDPKELLERVAALISEAFGFYHTGIFLLDERGEWAILKAASSQGGRNMLARGHRLKVGQEGLVGYTTAHNEARIVLDVGADSVHFENPDLPHTRSEMALPLQVRGKVLGALDVQSVEIAAFSDADVTVLQTMADQIAIAIHNARLFEQTERAKEMAEAANQAKSAFLANMSHELRTPLNAILGFTQLMRRDPSFGPDQRKNLRIMHQSGEHLLELLNDVLEMSKIEAGRATFIESDFDLHKLLANLESMFGARAQGKGLQLDFECAPDVPQYIRTDERKLRQTLINLLDNAVKFTERGGVTLRVSESASRRVGEVSLARLLFEVQDTGAGIAAEEMGQVFEAFTQTASGQKSLQGTGLGLALSRRFVQLMGGDITVASPPPYSPPYRGGPGGGGSVFRFDIQVAVPDIAALQERQPARRVGGLAPGQRAYRILVVEDREASRALLAQLLTTVGFEVREAANGQEALEVWQAWNPHLIWMDVRMPVMDGYEATKRIKSQISNLQSPIIIALTAHAFEEERAAILTVGCDDLVRKPFQEMEIFDKMAEHLGLRYVYEDLALPGEQDDDTQAPVALTPDDLAALPASWVADLRQAARAGEAKLVLELIEQIEKGHAPLAAALAQLVHEFRFDKLVALTRSGAG